MDFVLDENVPDSVRRMLIAQGHAARSVREYLVEGSADPLVAAVAEEIGAILVSIDGDFRKIAPRIPVGSRARFRRLSRIALQCSEPQAAKRMQEAMTLIEHEWAIAQKSRDKRMHIVIGNSVIRTHR